MKEKTIFWSDGFFQNFSSYNFKYFNKYTASPDLSRPDLSPVFLAMIMWQIGDLEDFSKKFKIYMKWKLIFTEVIDNFS